MDKIALAQKINSLTGLTKEEKAELTQLLNTKRYGLVWEDKPEAVEEELKTQLPVLQEVVERKVAPLTPKGGVVSAKPPQQPSQLGLSFGQEIAPHPPKGELKANEKAEEQTPPLGVGGLNHTLIEGDNLHALTVLNYTHANKIDVIYIDPPYNTGNKDFKYNDSFVDKEDGYRHSKWLSFMAKRLRLAKNLLSDKGVIFISIDDNEQAQLKLLCDEIFGEVNFVADIIWQKVYSPRMDAKGFSAETENVICFSKVSTYLPNKIKVKQESKQFNIYDKTAQKFYRRRSWRKEGSGSNRADRPNLFYPINAPDGSHILPIKSDKNEGRWRGNLAYFQELLDKNSIEFIKDKSNDWQIYVKQYLEEDAERPPTTLWLNEDVGHTHEASEEIKAIFGNSAFLTPKPTRLIRKMLEIGGDKNATILDFFAGSGTTLHSVMALNAEDGGSRQCILVTNNENNICEEVTYERNKRVIEGYYKNSPLTPKGGIADAPKADGAIFVPGLSGNNLRYYKTGYVGREKTLKNKKALVSLATEMLCLKEGVYSPLPPRGGTVTEKQIKVYQDNYKAFMIIYDEEYIDEAIALIQQIEIPNPIKVYIFANGQYPYTEDFEEVLDKIELCALPDAIYRAYQRLLPKEEN